jgi:hypothetical protein
MLAGLLEEVSGDGQCMHQYSFHLFRSNITSC